MVDWRGRRQSDNVEDRRGAAAGAGVILLLLRFVLGRFGVGGLLLLVLIGGGLYAVGVNPLALLSGAPSGRQAQAPRNDEESAFVRVILAETEQVWSDIFRNSGADYPEPKLVLFSGSVQSTCGFASSAAGPFYCPGDRKVYLDTSFFEELSRRFGAPGDFAAAYVIAHEVGHHVQTVVGLSDEVRAAQSRAGDQAAANELQVRMELQADCYAGLWAARADRTSGLLEAGDIEEGLRAAAAIGDDTLQRNAGRRVTPESFTHGTSAQRQEWFTRGYRAASVDACDTFNARSLWPVSRARRPARK